MSTTRYLPAGCESSSEDEFGFCYEEKRPAYSALFEKSEIETFKDNLVQCVKGNDVEGLRRALDEEASKGTASFDIDSPVDGDWNLLFSACFNGVPEIVDFLIRERNANVNIVNDEGCSTLMIACYSLVDSNNNNKNNHREATLEIAKSLLEKDPKLMHKRNASGETAMMTAAKNGHLMVVEYLISLGDSPDNVNNSGRNALFYAVEGRQTEVAANLFAHKIDYTVADFRGDTARSIATANEAVEILSLFPPEKYKYETPSAYLSYNTFRAIIPNSTLSPPVTPGGDDDGDDGEEDCIPAFFPDVVCMLRGMELEKFLPLFAKAGISLETFLTVDDRRLEEIGVELPLQRKIILHGLHNFFSEKWDNRSIWLPASIKSRISPVDLVYIFANLLRQTVVIKCHLIHLQALRRNKPHGSVSCNQSTFEHLAEFQNRIRELGGLVGRLEKTKRPLLIPKQARPLQCNIPQVPPQRKLMKWSVVITVSLMTITSIAAIKLLCRK